MKVKRTRMSSKTYMERLQKHGWMQIGAGSFSTVFVKGNRAIKVTRGTDYAYSAYARKIMKWGTRTPWFPKIFNAHRFLCVPSIYDTHNRSASEFTVYSLEKLDKVSYEEWDSMRFSIVREERICVKDLRVQRIMRILGRHFGLDLGSSNIMRRGLQVVLTDPIYTFRKDPAHVRM